GCVLYRMCTGQAPFRGRDTISTLMAVANEKPPPPRTVSADVPQPLSDLVMRLLEKDPANRPASAGEVAELLQAIGSPGAAAVKPAESRDTSGPTSSVDHTLTLVGARPSGKQRRRWVAVVAVLLVLAAGYFVTTRWFERLVAPAPSPAPSPT